MLLAWRNAMAFDSRQRLAEIACPTLILAAENDKAVPLHHAQLLHRGIAASELVIIDGAGRTLIWTHPEEFERVTDQFLSA
jgi:pimeloyl-ACP methyl ester carboxylesterase